MPSQGSVIARVYTSDAYLPIAQVPVIFTQTAADGTIRLLAVKTTDSSGLTEPLFIETAERSASLTPGSVIRPFITVSIMAQAPGYSSITADGVQIFPGVETIQGLQLRPIVAGENSISQNVPESRQDL